LQIVGRFWLKHANSTHSDDLQLPKFNEIDGLIPNQSIVDANYDAQRNHYMIIYYCPIMRL
jgi:hypothetical protein